MKRIEIIVLLVFLNALVVFGQQSTYVLTINTPDKIEDTSVEWGQSEIRGVNRQEGNNGQNIYIHAMAWTWDGIPGINRGLIKFDLDQLPANSEIVKAELSLYHYEIEDKCWPMSNLSGSNAVYVQRITSDWVEDEVTWNTQPTTTIENQVILPGSSSRTQDYLDIDVTELVNQIVVSGENYGFMLQLATEEYYRCMIFCSS
ncbi:MAG TPA: DNRLRE domain-containing protein, partial [Prolixibacteraceae bacterium]|nr:DNRLRE domain-containing protein [Prolixibacteraceae bacterium]